MNNRIKILILGFVAVLCTVLGIVSFNSKEDEGPIVENTVPQEADNPGKSKDATENSATGEVLPDGDSTVAGGAAGADGTATAGAENPGSRTSGKDKTPVQIAVFVCGEVNSPGVYSFYEGERIQAAVERAGGLTGDADENYINQAGYLTDGAKLYFPSREEVEKMTSEGRIPDALNDGGTFQNAEGEVTGNGGISSSVGQTNESTKLVNINTATYEELMTLPGVGQSKADSIINFRNEHGAFKRIEDIMNITGIKEGLFGKIKDKITV